MGAEPDAVVRKVNELVKKFTAGLSDHAFASARSLSLRLIQSGVHLSLVDDESSLCDAIRSSLRSGYKQNSATRFDELHMSFMRVFDDPGLRARVLLMLHLISRGSNSNVRPGSLHGSFSTFDGGLPVLHRSVESNGGGPTGPSSLNASFGGNPTTSRRDWNSNSTLPPRKRSSAALARPRMEEVGRASRERRVFEVNEPALVHDVLYVCQGIDGTYIKYDPHKHKENCQKNGAGGYVITKEAGVGFVTKRLVLQLCELGWLYKKVQEFVQSRVVHEGGAIRQAFCYAVNKELADYYRLMAVLEAQSVQPLPTAFPHREQSKSSFDSAFSTQSEMDRRSNSQAGVDGDREKGPYLSLRRLAVWLADPLRRMRLLSVLIDSTRRKSGGELAGDIYGHSKIGDPFAQNFVMRLLRRVSVPLFDMIKKWVYEGELCDPNKEFFIEDNHLSRAQLEGMERDMWRDGYHINNKMLPSFIDPTLASKILRAGKSINFLRSCCGDVEWVQERAATAQASADESMTYGQMESLQQLVDEASSLVDKRVIEVLSRKFLLDMHCEAIKRYLLLGQGDFVESLMESIQPELDKPSSQISELQLGGILRAAIHASNAKYDDDEILERLHVSKGKSIGRDKGWDVFSLEYRVNQPISTLFTPTAMSQYLRVFRLLWKLKQAEHTLNKVWHSMKCMEGALNRLPMGGGSLCRQLLRRSFTLRSKMAHFCTNMQYYIMLEVLEGAWHAFTTRAKRASDLDELLAAHENYLATIITRCLLDEDTQTLRDSLEKMFKLVAKTTGLVTRMGTETDAVMHKYRLAVQEAKRGFSQSQSDRPRVESLDVPEKQFLEIREVINGIAVEYEFFLNEFTKSLPTQAHVDLRFLMFRLDFADLYMKKEVANHDEDFDG